MIRVEIILACEKRARDMEIAQGERLADMQLSNIQFSDCYKKNYIKLFQK